MYQDAHPRRWIATIRAWLRLLIEWPLLLLLALLAAGIVGVSQRALQYPINVGYPEGWHSDQPLLIGWNTPEPDHAPPDERSYRWTADDSRVVLPGLGAQPALLTVDQLGATANPAATGGVLHVAATDMAISAPIDRDRALHVLIPASAAQSGALQILAPTFTPPNDPRPLGANIEGLALTTYGGGFHVPPIGLFWPLPLLIIAWATARRWCVRRRAATVAGLILIGLLLAALWGDRLRWALAGGPLLMGALWGVIVGGLVLLAIERWASALDVRPSPLLARVLALLVFWLMLLRYGGRLYPESMIGDLGFHINRELEVIAGRIHLISKHRGINFPYPSAVYVLLAPFYALPIASATIVEWFDALFSALGVLPVAYLALRGTRDERTTLFTAIVYALLAPAMMALWWSFLAHIFTQETIPVLIAVLVGGWAQLRTRRGIALVVVVLCLIFFGHFGLFINVSVLLALLIAVLWWRLRGTPQIASVRGLALAFVIAEALVLGLFYSAYVDLIVTKLEEFASGGMGAVQGGRAAISRWVLLESLWRDGLWAHYAIVGVPLALLGGYWLWQQHRGEPIAWLFWGTIVVAAVQGAIPFLTASTITTRWMSFIAWTIALGLGIVLARLWQRGVLGRVLTLVTLVWIGGNTLWLWVQALGYRIRPIEPF